MEVKALDVQPVLEASVKQPDHYVHIISGFEKLYVRLKMWSRIITLAIRNYPTASEAFVALKKLSKIVQGVFGKKYGLKVVENEGKYYYSLYAPGFPSKAFDQYIIKTLNGIHPFDQNINNLTFIFFAITRKCPLRCEHCFEADNLNQPETFTLDQLKAVVARFQKDELPQFHFSGGEPMVRMKDLKEVRSERS